MVCVFVFGVWVCVMCISLTPWVCSVKSEYEEMRMHNPMGSVVGIRVVRMNSQGSSFVKSYFSILSPAATMLDGPRLRLCDTLQLVALGVANLYNPEAQRMHYIYI